MDQKSNVPFRAEKEYKNSREKFYLLLREIISNSIQAVLIRKDKEKKNGVHYTPSLTLDIIHTDDKCKITLTDNGEGFTPINSECFESLDKRNTEKVSYNFHPLGQGRLAIVYFSDEAEYETVYKDEGGELKKKRFPYPSNEEGIYTLDLFQDETPEEKDSFTKLRIIIDKQQTLGRAKTFFKKYDDAESLKLWFFETFFPVIVTNEDLIIDINYNHEQVTIKKGTVESETKTIPFNLKPDEDGKAYDFKLWLIKKKGKLKGENQVDCFARNLRATLSNGKLIYTVDSEEGYSFFLTSDYFDEFVDTKGERIDVSIEAIKSINEKITELLDKEFIGIIETNRKETKRNLDNFRKKYPSLDAFVPNEDIEGRKEVIDEDYLVQKAVDTKGKIEKKFWTHMNKPVTEENEDPYDESEECEKLLNSSLHIYVKHRERVLQRLCEMIKPYDEEGNEKPELEKDVHELLFRRGTTLEGANGINHLHNLWILDDKFTTFSPTFKAKSTKQGQALSDVYIWADAPKTTKQILILELKSTTDAHNAGNKNEGMIGQVKRYASDFYNNPEKTLNWDVDTAKVQYLGIILARKSDINKELTSNNIGGTYDPIPFLENSYYRDDYFTPVLNKPKEKVNIRIELYSFEDIYLLAQSRNEVFFRLLRNELGIEEDRT